MSSSDPVRVTATAVPCAVETVWALAVGVPTATLSVTVAGALVLVPLLVVKVKVSAPWKPAAGV